MPTRQITAVIMDEHTLLTYTELQQATSASDDFIVELVEHEFIVPLGSTPDEWQFDAECLRRTRLALRFSRDLEVNVAGITLIVDLLDQLEQLRRELALHRGNQSA